MQKEMMQLSSRMSQRVALYTASLADDGMGGQVVTWNALATVWGEVVEALSPEREEGGQRRAEPKIRVVIRYRGDVVTGMRLVFRAVPYRVLGVRDLFARKLALELMCERE